MLRRGRVEDTEALADFTAMHVGPEAPDEGIRHWTRDLMKGDLPGFGPQDFTIVEDSRTGAIVATMNLISQTWSYEGVEFPVGRIELVGTHTDYRLRGLMRAQLDTVHRWSAERGELVQGITGIPWFYRRFGYEMTMEHMGGRIVAVEDVPGLPPGEVEPYTLREATDDDIPFLARTYRRSTERLLVSCVRDEEMWRYELVGRGEGSMFRFGTLVIESMDGRSAGTCCWRRAGRWRDHVYGVRGRRPTFRGYRLRPPFSVRFGRSAFGGRGEGPSPRSAWGSGPSTPLTKSPEMRCRASSGRMRGSSGCRTCRASSAG